MDKKVIWMHQTYEDLDSICEFISRDSVYYASSFLDRILKAGDSLDKFYKRGRIVPEKDKNNIREIFVGDFRIIYEITENTINILTVIHGRRDLKKIIKKKKF